MHLRSYTCVSKRGFYLWNPTLIDCFAFEITSLHKLGKQEQDVDGKLIGKNLHLTAGYDVLKEQTDNNNFDFRKVRFYAGNVKWSAGQLEKEVDANYLANHSAHIEHSCIK